MKRIYWTGFSKEDRTSGIIHIEEGIDNLGFIIDYKFFSDISVSLIIESEENKVEKLYQELLKIIAINDYEKFDTDSTKECTILLNITFAKSSGNLKIEVPAIPG